MSRLRDLILHPLSHLLFKCALKTLQLPAFFLILAACSNGHQEAPSAINHVSGNAVKGVISNGVVSAYLVDSNTSNAARTLLGQTRTDNFGEYEINIPTFENDPIIALELTADSQTTMRCDLVDGCLYPDNTNASNILLADFGTELPLPKHFKLLGYKQGEGQHNTYISPLSHIVYTTASSLPGGLSNPNLETASGLVAQTFNLDADLLSAKTPDLTALSDIHGLTDQQLKQGVLSSAFYSLTMTDAWSKGELDLSTLPLEEIFRDAAYSAETLSEQLSTAQNGYSEALFAINTENQAQAQAFENKQLMIIQQPNSLTVNEENSFSLHVQAGGDGSISYQWKKNNQDIVGANSATYSVANANLSDAGSYSVIVSNNGESLTSLHALITVTQVIKPISIIDQPRSLSLTVGDPIHLSVGISGDGPYDYQWKKDNQDIVAANLASYSVASANLSDAGSYNVTIMSNGNSLTSFNALVSVSPIVEPISITLQPQALNLAAGDPINLSVSVTGDGPYNYQWQKGGSILSSETNSTLYIAKSVDADSGTYSVTISNGVSEASSDFVSVIINAYTQHVTITEQPQTLNLTAGDPINLSVSVTGDGPYNYQWQKGGSILPSETNSMLYIAESVEADSGTYRVTVSNDVSEASSDFVNVMVNTAIQPVTINQHPVNLTVTEGETANFQVSATGGGFISYQWRINSININSAYTNQLEINATDQENTGNYDVIVTNSRGSITSNAATLTVLSSEVPVSITLQPISKSVFLTDSINLRTEASGDGILSYQWFLDGQIVVGANQAEYSINSAEPEHQGSYTVVVNNTSSSEESLAAFISVTAKPSVQLSWDIPSLREDSSPLDISEISAYILEYGYSLSATAGVVRLTDANTTHYTLTNLEPGILYARIATIDSSDVQGQFSDWVSVTIE